MSCGQENEQGGIQSIASHDTSVKYNLIESYTNAIMADKYQKAIKSVITVCLMDSLETNPNYINLTSAKGP